LPPAKRRAVRSKSSALMILSSRSQASTVRQVSLPCETTLSERSIACSVVGRVVDTSDRARCRDRRCLSRAPRPSPQRPSRRRIPPRGRPPSLAPRGSAGRGTARIPAAATALLRSVSLLIFMREA
jgi:hypothetical protein